MKCKLIDIVNLIGGGTPKTSISEYWNGDIPWLSVKDFNNDNRYVYSTEKTITQAGVINSSTKMLQVDDIIISARGTVGELAMIPFPMAFNQSCYGIRGYNDKVTQTYLYYLLKNSITLLKSKSHGSVFDTITRDTFSDIEVDLPPLAEQKVIADTLAVLDDKIEINNKINHHLEQIAQAVFKERFSDFESTKPFTEIVQILGGGTPKTGTEEFWNGNIPFFTPKDTNGSYVLETEKQISDDGLAHCNSRLFPINTVFVTARGTVGKLSLAGCKMSMNQSCYALIGKEGYGQYFVFHLAKRVVESLKHKANGAVFDAIVTRDFESEKVLDVAIDKAVLFNKEVSPFYEAIFNNSKENRRLVKLRDAILPRLMSGALPITNLLQQEA